jgi:hypothetical protein
MSDFPSLTLRSPRTLDLVHDNPGDAPYVTAFNEPEHLKSFGFDSKVFMIFDSPQLAINWEGFDPTIFPKGSEERAWVDAKAARLKKLYVGIKAAGVGVLCMSDLILLPKRLAAAMGAEGTDWRDPRHPRTQELLRHMIAESFEILPELDGLIVRIGETYLDDAPHHAGGIREKKNPEETIIPLMQLLREELCVKRGKTLFFRTWLSFDTDPEAYAKVDAAVEPHPLLNISVKHCEGDFHRGNRFSRVIGQGRHPQIIEVQCAREYEGKGCYPNYVLDGVINSFEEYAFTMDPGDTKGLREFARTSPLYAGVWTWSRGGGWLGPYTKNEFWCSLNAWVSAHWARDPRQTEEEVFLRYCSEVLKLSTEDAARFRKLCVLSAKAVIRGKRTTHNDIRPWWSRDQYIGEPDLPKDSEKRDRVLAQKYEAEGIWKEICDIASKITFADTETQEFVRVSCDYGRFLYTIYRLAFELKACEEKFDTATATKLLAEYDAVWQAWRESAERSPSTPSLYKEEGFRYNSGKGAWGDVKHGVGPMANRLKRKLG